MRSHTFSFLMRMGAGVPASLVNPSLLAAAESWRAALMRGGSRSSARAQGGRTEPGGQPPETQKGIIRACGTEVHNLALTACSIACDELVLKIPGAPKAMPFLDDDR